jgi:hypothetical protein
MISVITNSKGQRITPQVSVNDNPSWPKRVKFAGSIPNNPSSEKSFMPMASAISAFATKKARKPANNFVGLSCKILCIIRRKGYYDRKKK